MARRAGFLLIILSCLLTLVLIRVTSDKLGQITENRLARDRTRFMGIMSIFDEITSDPSRTNFFIGTSPVQFFLSPIALDESLARQGASTITYNFGFAGLMGPAMFSFTSRLQSELERRHKKVGATFIEYSPVGLSHDLYLIDTVDFDIVRPAVFYSARMWSRLFVADVPNAAYMFFNNLIRPFEWTMITTITDPLLLDRRTRPEHHGVGIFWNRREYFEIPTWNPATRGLSNWNLPRTAAHLEGAFKWLHIPIHWEEMMSGYTRVMGLNERFTLDRKNVDTFINSIKIAQTFSERVYLVGFPYTPSFQALADKYAPDDALRKRVKDETGLDVIDLRTSLNLTDEDFADAMHPRLATMNRLLAVLAERVAPDFTQTKRMPASQ